MPPDRSSVADLVRRPRRASAWSMAILAALAAGCTAPWADYGGYAAKHEALKSVAFQQRSDAADRHSSVRDADDDGHPADVAGSVPAGEIPNEVTLEQALSFMLDNHPRLRARTRQVEVARAALITAGLLPNPQLVLDTESPLQSNNPTELTSRVMFTLPTGGKRERAMMAAKAGIAEARLAIDSEAHVLLMQTVDATLATLHLQELVKLEDELSETAEAAAALQRQRVKLGGVPAPDVLAPEVDAAEIQFERMRHAAQLEAARWRLSRAIGLAQPKEMVVRGSLEVQPVGHVDLDGLLAEVERNRPELAQAEAAVRKSRLDAAAARAKAVPDLQFGPRFHDKIGDPDDSLGARVAIDLPIFDRKQGDIYKFDSQAHVNDALRDDVRIASLHDVADAFGQLRPLELAIAHYDDHVQPLVVQTEALLRDPQALLVIDPVKISNELRKLGKLKVEQLELRYRHELIRAKLELLVGRRLREGADAETIGPGETERSPADAKRPPAAPPLDTGGRASRMLPAQRAQRKATDSKQPYRTTAANLDYENAQ